MNIIFEMADTDDLNAANPCCCPELACPKATIEYQYRDAEDCIGGYPPYYRYNDGDDEDTRPNAFDLWTVGKLVPLYKKSEFAQVATRNGTVSSTWKHYSEAGAVLGTYEWNASLSFDFTWTTTSEAGKAIDEWPAGSEPFGQCPPEDTIIPVDAPTPNASKGEVDEGTVEVKLSIADVRPNHPTETDGDGAAVKCGHYEWMVDGSIYGNQSNELTIHLNEGDTTCHEFRVRHICGGNGKWSKAKVFSMSDNPCCKEAEKPACNDKTTGNEQWSGSQQYLSANGSTSWTSVFSGGDGIGDPSSQSGNSSACDGTSPTNTPPVFSEYYPLQWVDNNNADTVVVAVSANEHSVTSTWLESTSLSAEPDPEDPSFGWFATSQADTGTAKLVEKTTLSEDRNKGTSSVDTLFSKLLATVKGYADTYNWRPGGSQAVAVGGYPETQMGSNGTGIIFVRVRQIRHRWKVPADYDGDSYKTQWNIGRFHERWLTWKEEYYTWAVEKYAFLQKPKPGDDAYPKRKDFESDDDYKAAVDAIDDIKDPGKAPVEPEGLKPEIVSSPGPWVWKSSQGESADEKIDQCDPTKALRELHEPVKPKRQDYGTDEQFKSAMASYESNLASYRAAVDARKANSKRQSPWYVTTPDKWSDYRTKPDPVPPLPDEPTEQDRKDHERATKRYDFLLEKFNTAHHAALFICNVRHTCNIGDPAGEIENWDRAFLTTSLPDLDPTKEDPSRWSEWY